jgi:hypothetical protein
MKSAPAVAGRRKKKKSARTVAGRNVQEGDVTFDTHKDMEGNRIEDLQVVWFNADTAIGR